MTQSDFANEQDLRWIKTEIVDRYNFVKERTRDIWTSQPDFRSDLGTSKFIAVADRVKKFFDRNNDWETTKKNPEFRTKDSCTYLLYITAARYLLVTHILYVQSGKKLTPCQRTRDRKIMIPDSGVCYPAPYGSATCTSDYDVGLVGKDAGTLTEKFNKFFQGVSGFGKPSELVFDTNVYAFTLEFAMPVILFAGLPASFAKNVAKKEQTIAYKMRELASAYYKVYKYNENFFNAMVDSAKTEMRKSSKATKSKNELDIWLETFRGLNARVPMQFDEKRGRLTTLNAFRTAHNKEYQDYVKRMSANGGYKSDSLGKNRHFVFNISFLWEVWWPYRQCARLPGGTPFYGLYMYVRVPKGMAFRPFLINKLLLRMISRDI